MFFSKTINPYWKNIYNSLPWWLFILQPLYSGFHRSTQPIETHWNPFDTTRWNPVLEGLWSFLNDFSLGLPLHKLCQIHHCWVWPSSRNPFLPFLLNLWGTLIFSLSCNCPFSVLWLLFSTPMLMPSASLCIPLSWLHLPPYMVLTLWYLSDSCPVGAPGVYF